MEDKKEISIIYKHYVPDDWIEEFGTNINRTDISFNKSKDKDEFYNFTSPEFADIIIFIRDNPESIFLAPALYDIFKAGVVKLWNKLTNINIQKMQSGKTKPKEKKISIRYKDAQQRQITIDVEGDHDSELIEEIVEESLEIIRTEKKEEIFQQPDFVDNLKGYEAIALKYNTIDKVWEPKNFGEIRRRMDKHKKWAEDNLNS